MNRESASSKPHAQRRRSHRFRKSHKRTNISNKFISLFTSGLPEFQKSVNFFRELENQDNDSSFSLNIKQHMIVLHDCLIRAFPSPILSGKWKSAGNGPKSNFPNDDYSRIFFPAMFSSKKSGDHMANYILAQCPSFCDFLLHQATFLSIHHRIIALRLLVVLLTYGLFISAYDFPFLHSVDPTSAIFSSVFGCNSEDVSEPEVERKSQKRPTSHRSRKHHKSRYSSKSIAKSVFFLLESSSLPEKVSSPLTKIHHQILHNPLFWTETLNEFQCGSETLISQNILLLIMRLLSIGPAFLDWGESMMKLFPPKTTAYDIWWTWFKEELCNHREEGNKNSEEGCPETLHNSSLFPDPKLNNENFLSQEEWGAMEAWQVSREIRHLMRPPIRISSNPVLKKVSKNQLPVSLNKDDGNVMTINDPDLFNIRSGQRKDTAWWILRALLQTITGAQWCAFYLRQEQGKHILLKSPPIIQQDWNIMAPCCK